jgi:hypothetical protein
MLPAVRERAVSFSQPSMSFCPIRHHAVPFTRARSLVIIAMFRAVPVRFNAWSTAGQSVLAVPGRGYPARRLP